MLSTWHFFNVLLVFFLSYQLWKVDAFDQVIIFLYYFKFLRPFGNFVADAISDNYIYWWDMRPYCWCDLRVRIKIKKIGKKIAQQKIYCTKTWNSEKCQHLKLPLAHRTIWILNWKFAIVPVFWMPKASITSVCH